MAWKLECWTLLAIAVFGGTVLVAACLLTLGQLVACIMRWWP